MKRRLLLVRIASDYLPLSALIYAVKKLDVLWPLMHPIAAVATARKWIGNPVSSSSHIFVVGAPRSGTTLLKTLIVSHSQIAGTLYESTGLFRYRNYYEYQASGLEKSWVAKQMRSQAKLVPLYDRIASAFIEREDASVFLDKLTVQRWRLNFVAKYFPNAKFLNIVRDGRDCFCSALRHPNVHQSESCEAFARYWSYCVNTVDDTMSSDQCLTIRYEDLTEKPDEQTKRIMAWLGFEYESSQIDPAVYRPQISKRDVHKNLSNAVNTSSRERWRKEMSDGQKSRFVASAERALLKCRYSVQ